MRPALEHRPTLVLRHTAPDPELGRDVRRVGKAVGDHRAADADLLGSLLSSAPDGQGVGLSLAADPVLRLVLEPTRNELLLVQPGDVSW
jgi:hypothetical protein